MPNINAIQWGKMLHAAMCVKGWTWRKKKVKNRYGIGQFAPQPCRGEHLPNIKAILY